MPRKKRTDHVRAKEKWLASSPDYSAWREACPIRVRRKALGLRACDVADSLDIALSTVYRWENGSNLSEENAYPLAALLKWELDTLLHHLEEWLLWKPTRVAKLHSRLARRAVRSLNPLVHWLRELGMTADSLRMDANLTHHEQRNLFRNPQYPPTPECYQRVALVMGVDPEQLRFHHYTWRSLFANKSDEECFVTAIELTKQSAPFFPPVADVLQVREG